MMTAMRSCAARTTPGEQRLADRFAPEPAGLSRWLRPALPVPLVLLAGCAAPPRRPLGGYKITGRVTAQGLVQADGTVASFSLLELPHELLSQAVPQALARWKISPADGEAADQLRLRQPFEFRVAP
jgi:hypothetical protein